MSDVQLSIPANNRSIGFPPPSPLVNCSSTHCSLRLTLTPTSPLQWPYSKSRIPVMWGRRRDGRGYSSRVFASGRQRCGALNDGIAFCPNQHCTWQDAVNVVRQSSIQIWRALVHNTPRTGRSVF